MLRRNVLIFHQAALGDFLLTLPVAMALGRVLAQSRIFYVTSSQKGQLAERLIGTEFVDAESGWHGLFGDGKISEQAEKMLKSMQMAVVFAQNDPSAMIGNLAKYAGDLPIIVLAPNPPDGVHVWDHQLLQLASSPVIQNGVQQVQVLIKSQGLKKQSRDPSKVVIHPGSGAERKNWPIEKFLELATRLNKEDKSVTLTIGEVERERISKEKLKQFEKVATICDCHTLIELYQALNMADHYFGNDSGPTHLASMMGLNVVAMFGPTSNPASWSPVGPRVRIESFDTQPGSIQL